MKTPTILAGVLLSCSPAAAQLSPEAYTWGAEVPDAGRSTVISARKTGASWTIVMECSAPGRDGRERLLRYRGKVTWSGGMMLGTLDSGMRIAVCPGTAAGSASSCPGRTVPRARGC